jgi:hypothetical protein
MKYKKIFCIGFSKTGTSSLYKAFKILGLESCHHRARGELGLDLIEKAAAEGEKVMHYMEQYDAYSDMILDEYYQILDGQYPGSGFIFMQRDPEKWVISKINHDKSGTLGIRIRNSVRLTKADATSCWRDMLCVAPKYSITLKTLISFLISKSPMVPGGNRFAHFWICRYLIWRFPAKTRPSLLFSRVPPLKLSSCFVSLFIAIFDRRC